MKTLWILILAGVLFGGVVVRTNILAAPPGATDATASTQPHAAREPITRGQRIFSTGHSFHHGFAPILNDIAISGGFKDSTIVGVSNLGGSKVENHLGNKDAQAALQAGTVDVLMMTPIYLPDSGIEKFAQAGVAHNPNIRLTMMEFWLPFDQYEPRYYVGQHDPQRLPMPAKVDHNAMTAERLRGLHDRYFREMDELVTNINTKLGQPVVYVVPVGQAVIALRDKIILGQAPGLKEQKNLFSDALGHPNIPLTIMMGYCHYAVIYRQSPVGLPVPAKLRTGGINEKDLPALNRLLQEIAWDAVIHHPLSGVTGTSDAAAPTP